MSDTVSSLAQKLRPFWLRDVGGTGGILAGGGGDMVAHALAGAYHTGELLEAQATWAATKAELAALDIHPRLHGILSTDDHSVTGSAGQLIGLTAANTLGLLTPLSDVTGATNEAILKSNSLGELALTTLYLSTGYVRSAVGLVIRNVANTAYQPIAYSYAINTLGLTYADSPFAFRDRVTSAWRTVGTGGLMASNTDHTSLIPANGIYALGAIRGDTKLSTPLIDTLSGANMTIAPAVDLLLQPGSSLVKLQSGVALQSHNYASQLTGVRVTAAGEGDFRYLFADEMHAKSFIADLEQALAGGQIISKSVAELAYSFVAPAPGGWAALYVKDLPSAANMQVFQEGDVVCVRQFDRSGGALAITFCWGQVYGYIDGDDPQINLAGAQYWAFQRSVAPNAGAMTAGTVIQPNAIILDFGVSGNGYYEVNAIDGLRGVNSPYLRFVRWTGHPATGAAERVRLGNLRGIFNQDEYGLFAGTGTANSDRYLRLSDYAAGNGINNLPFRLRNAGVTTVEFNAWNDVWMGPSSADKRFIWDGSLLTVKGAIVITEASSGYGNLSDKPASLSAINSGEGTKLSGIQAGATVGATWGVNLGSQPTSLAGINSSEGTKLGGIEAGATVGANWSTNISNKPTTLAGINSAEGTKLGGIATGATVGATWGVNLNTIPPRFAEAPVGGVVGLHLTPTNLGYWNGSAWKMWMNNAGQFYFGGDTGARLQWDGTILAGYNSANAVQWAASSVTGQFTAGAGAVVLDANGEKIYRTTYISTAAIPEPGFGTLPNLSPVPAQTLEWRDTAETFYRVGPPGSYYYPGNTVLRVYASSNHHIPYSDPAMWSHYIDSVIEMPAITEAGDNNDYTRRMWLRAPYIILDGVVRASSLSVGAYAVHHAGNLVSPIDRASFNGDFRSSNTVVLYNLAASAYQGILTQFVTNNSGNFYGPEFVFYNGDGSDLQTVKASSFFTVGGGIYSDAAIVMLKSNGGGQQVRADSFLAGSDYALFSPRVPTNGIYTQGAVAIGTPGAITAGYSLDVNGAVRVRGSLAANSHINLSPIAEPATSAATGILWMGTDNKLYFKKPSGTPILVAG